MLEEADRRRECWSDIVKLLLKKMALLDDTRVSEKSLNPFSRNRFS